MGQHSELWGLESNYDLCRLQSHIKGSFDEELLKNTYTGLIILLLNRRSLEEMQCSTSDKSREILSFPSKVSSSENHTSFQVKSRILNIYIYMFFFFNYSAGKMMYIVIVNVTRYKTNIMYAINKYIL